MSGGQFCILRSLSSDVFERRLSTESRLTAVLRCDFEQVFGQIVPLRVQTLSNTNLVASRHIKRKKAHFRLTCVAQKRRCFNTLLCPTYRPFPHYAPVSKYKETRTRLGWMISYKSLYFSHPSLELVPLCTGMRERSIRDRILEHIQDDQ